LVAGCGDSQDVVEPPRLTVMVDDPRARDVAARFVNTAVARRNLAASWDVTHPALRVGYTRARWAEGTIPVQVVPGARVRSDGFRLIQADDEEAVYTVRVRGRRFLVTLRRYGEPSRWGVAGFDAAIAP
jgi:hypothetical protein